MDIIQSILLALFQGVVEWLPISSEGQLSLFFVNILSIDNLEAVTLSLLLHIGTMLSVIVYFWKDFKELWRLNAKITNIILYTTLGTAITAIPVVLIFKDFWENQTLNFPTDGLFTLIIGIFLIITGLILAKNPEKGIREIESLSNKEEVILGMVQGLAALPGISRSGVTISFLLFIGLKQRDALRTSFVISVPAVMGATGLEFLLKGFFINENNLIIGSTIFPIWIFIITTLFTFIVGLLAMNTFLQFKNIAYDRFCLGLGIITILFSLIMFYAYIFL